MSFLIFYLANLTLSGRNTARKIKFSIKDFISKCDQICSFQQTWSHLLKKSLMENFIFCAVKRFSSFSHLNFSFHISQFSYVLRILAEG